MKKRYFAMVSALAILLVAPLAMAQGENPCNPCGKGGTRFYVNDPMGRNSVTFKSTAPLEDIVGTTNQITGYIEFDPENPQKGGHGELNIPVASLNTGIPLRDEHLQGPDWMDAKKYPTITLHIRDVRNIKRVKSTPEYQTYDLTLVGELSFHGRTMRVEFPGRLTFLKESEQTRKKMPGDLLAARATFDVNLNDFAVTGPKGSGLVGSRVGESIAIDIGLIATNSSVAMAGNPCNPCGGKAKNPCNPCNPCGGKAKNPCNPCGD